MSGDEGRPGSPDGDVTSQLPKPPLDPTVEPDATRLDLPVPRTGDGDATAVFQAPASVTDATVAFDETTGLDPGRTSVLNTPAVDPDATVAFTTLETGATVGFEPEPGEGTAVLDRPAGAPVPGGEGRTQAVPFAQPEQPMVRITPQEHAPAVPAWPAAKGGRRPRGRLRTVLIPMIPILAAAGVAAFILWNRLGNSGPAVTVTGVTMTAPATASCGQTVHVSAAITTNGGSGTIAYKWSRSDGQESPTQTLNATKDQTSYPVTLSWQIQGRGRFDAVATMTVTSPTGTSPATARFLYTC